MKLNKTSWWSRRLRHVPVAAQVFELAIGLVVFSALSGTLAVLVGASPDISPPSVPLNLQLSGRSATEIDISWSASTDDVGVTGYHVYRNGSVIAAITGTTYADISLSPNTSYSYTVSAYDAAGNESAQSSPLSAATLADTSAPSVPMNLHQTGQTTSSVSIAWNASADNVGVTGYNIYRNGSLIKTQTGTTFTDTGLGVYSGYNYNITAYDAANNSSNLSATLVGSTAQDVTPPSVPDTLQETTSTVSSVSLSWNASTDDVGVAGYHVYRNGSLIAAPGGTSYTDSGLNVSSNYSYTVSAYDAAGNESAQSAPLSARSSDDTTAPSTPLNLQTSSIQDTSLTFSWNASTDNVGVTGYKVYRDGSLLGTTTTTSYRDSGLTPVTTYDYRVEAYDAANNVSPQSQVLSVRTAYDTTPPSVPTNVSSPSQTDQSITLSWSASTDNVAVTGYDVYRNGSLITSSTGTSYTDSGLGVATSYIYTVRAHDSSANNSDQTPPVSISTLPDRIPPTSPMNVASVSQTTTSIDITWNAATDDIGVSGYKIYRNGTFVATVGGTEYNDTALPYNTSFSYTVSAYDNAGNDSGRSAVITVATLPDTMPPTVALQTPANGQAVQLIVPISATASDDLALSHVKFFVDSTLIADLVSAPFSLNWDSYAAHNGPHTITAEAFDASGNSATQSAVITINNPPPALLGDLNGDHKINLLDLSILLSHWGRAGAGDFNNNGRVDIFDLSVLLSHYGQDNSNYH